MEEDIRRISEVRDTNFGRSMREPLRDIGGMVFGRRLTDCVKDTAVDEVKKKLLSGEYYGEVWRREKIPSLEDRLLPALVLRCAQHLLTHGIHEEDLFWYAFSGLGVLGLKSNLHSSVVLGSMGECPWFITCAEILIRELITTLLSVTGMRLTPMLYLLCS